MVNGSQTRNILPAPRISERTKRVDRGPAWIVAGLAGIALGMHYGMLNCGALLYPGLIELTDQPISVVTWMVTGQFAVAFCPAPLYNRLLDFVRFRIASILAVFLTTTAFIGASYVNSYAAFFALYTVAGGIGMGVSVVRVVGIAAEYFDHYRTLGLAVCTSGAGLGTFIYAKLGAFMIEQYTWRVALMGYALIHAHLIVILLLLHPIPSDPVAEPTVLLPGETIEPLLANPTQTPHTSFIQPGNILQSNYSLSGGATRKFNTRYGNQGGVGENTETHNRRLVAEDLRVVIEFCPVSQSIETGECQIAESMVLPDTGLVVQNQITTIAMQYMELNNVSSVRIPMVFIISDSDNCLEESKDNTSFAQVNVLTTRRRRSIRNSTVEMGLIPIADSLISSTMILRERDRVKQLVKKTVKEAELRVLREVEQQQVDGFHVSNIPIVVLVDQSSYFPNCNLFNLGSTNLFPMTASRGNILLDAIRSNTAPKRNVVNATVVPRKAYASDSTMRLHSIAERPGVLHMGSQAVLASLPQGLDRSYTSEVVDNYDRQTDILTSVISVYNPQEAINFLMSKIERKNAMVETRKEGQSMFTCMLANPLFCTFLLSRLLVYNGDSIHYAHMNSFGLSVGLDENQAASLLSLMGISNMFARVVTGTFAQFVPGCDTKHLTATCLLLLSIHTILMPLYPTNIGLSIYAVSYGAFVSPSFAFAPLMVHEISGPARYDEAVSYWLQFEAVGYLVGGPMGGVIREISGNYWSCFILAGVSNFVASMILFAQKIVLSGLWEQIRGRSENSKI